MTRLNRPFLLALGWTFLILGLCSIPGSEIPQVDVLWIDKLVHAGLFAVFAVLWLHTGRSLRSAVLRTLLGGGLYAVLTELYQGWIPMLNRTPDPIDAAANLLGLLIGLGAYAWWQRIPDRSR